MISRLLAYVKWRGILPAVLASFFFLSSQGQTYIALREIVNYQKQHYNAGAQNWAIRQDAQGRIYFANNEGLLCFDGIYWKLYPLPNKTIVRSIEFGKDNRIYIGGQDEIGFFSPDKTGNLSYTSLRSLLPEPERKFADIWDLVQYGEEIFFRSNNQVFRYAQNKMTVFRSSSWLFIGQANNKLIAQDQQKGLLEFHDQQWKILIEKALLPPGFDANDILSINKDSSLITTNKN